VSELRVGAGVGPVSRDTPDALGDGDLALAFLRADATRAGYVCDKPHCSRCGKHFSDYLKMYGIISPSAEKRILEHEVMAYEELSTWHSE